VNAACRAHDGCSTGNQLLDQPGTGSLLVLDGKNHAALIVLTGGPAEAEGGGGTLGPVMVR